MKKSEALTECDEEEESIPLRKSHIAIEIAELKQAVEKAQQKRSKLPQPLFWSLFSKKIESIKEKKAIESTIRGLLDSGEE